MLMRAFAWLSALICPVALAYWEQVPGYATAIAVGANGAVWSVGLEGGLYQFRGRRFEKRYPGGFWRIVVGPDGEPWPIDEKQQVVRLGPTGWQPIRGDTANIAIGANGLVWVVDGAQSVCRLEAGGLWLRRGGNFREIAVGPDGLPWAITVDNRIFRRMPDS